MVLRGLQHLRRSPCCSAAFILIISDKSSIIYIHFKERAGMYQQITIVGNVGRDATLKYTSAGIAVADFSVAVEKVTGSGENRQKGTTWFRVTCWRNLGEIAGQYVKKGGKILVVGEIAASSYVDKAGVTQVTLELTADNFKLLSSRAEMEQRAGGEGSYNGGGGGQSEEDMYAPAPQQAPKAQRGGGRGKQQPPEGDNDIPF
jgi:single-strand DNA-binding protein